MKALNFTSIVITIDNRLLRLIRSGFPIRVRELGLNIGRKPSATVAFWLAVIPGLIGIFGLGHLYLGRIRRGYAFLSITAVLAVMLLVAFAAPRDLPALLAAPGMPAIWFMGWIAGMWDIRNITSKIEEDGDEESMAQQSIPRVAVAPTK
jgi:hypothetical protein